MTTQHNPAEIARLIAEAREDDARMTRGPWSVPSGTRLLGAVNATIDGMDRQVASAAGQALQFDDTADVGRQLGINAEAIARTRNNLRAMADQLEAAGREIDRLTACMSVAGLQCFMRGSSPDSVAEHMRNVARSWTELESKATAERDRLRAERDRAVEDMEAAEQRMAAFLDGTFAVGDGTAQREIERLRAEVERTKLWSCPDCEFTFAAYHTNADGSMSCPVCEVERMRPVVEAAVRVAELDEICDAHPGINDEVGHRAESELYAAVPARTAAVDSYRAARDRAGG